MLKSSNVSRAEGIAVSALHDHNAVTFNPLGRRMIGAAICLTQDALCLEVGGDVRVIADRMRELVGRLSELASEIA